MAGIELYKLNEDYIMLIKKSENWIRINNNYNILPVQILFYATEDLKTYSFAARINVYRKYTKCSKPYYLIYIETNYIIPKSAIEYIEESQIRYISDIVGCNKSRVIVKISDVDIMINSNIC